MTKDTFVRQIAKSLDLPESLVEKLIEPRTAVPGEHPSEWKLVRIPSVEELREYGLEARFASAGWRTVLRSLIEE